MIGPELGAFAFVALLALLALRIPIGVSMIAVGLGAYLIMRGASPTLAYVKNTSFSAFADYGLSVVPLFLSRRGTRDQTAWIEEPFTVPSEGDREEVTRAAAQRWADLFGAHLRRDPSQWTVLEAYWEVHACG